MQYRYITKNKINISQLGFGCMRFPILNDDPALIDEEKATEMLDYAIDKGVNYIDTAYNYHQGKSETFVGKYLKGGKREKIYLATKLPVWLVKTYEDFEKLLDEQLEKLQTNYIDFYLLHSLYEKTWRNIVDLNVFKFLEEAKKKGKIKYIGFSFHDEFPLFKEIINSYDWDFCQIQLNYMDRDYQAGLAGLSYAKEKDISVIIMEPIKGGKLANASEDILKIWDKNCIKRSPAEWALRWLYNSDDPSIVLSGMSTLDQVKENLNTANDGLPNSLTDDELSLIDEVTKVYNDRFKIGCTSCEYCLPCPSNVSIPNIFELYNNMYVYDIKEKSLNSYMKLKDLEKDATKCTECGACEGSCPQHLSIIEFLKEVDKAMATI